MPLWRNRIEFYFIEILQFRARAIWPVKIAFCDKLNQLCVPRLDWFSQISNQVWLTLAQFPGGDIYNATPKFNAKNTLEQRTHLVTEWPKLIPGSDEGAAVLPHGKDEMAISINVIIHLYAGGYANEAQKLTEACNLALGAFAWQEQNDNSENKTHSTRVSEFVHHACKNGTNLFRSFRSAFCRPWGNSALGPCLLSFDYIANGIIHQLTAEWLGLHFHNNNYSPNFFDQDVKHFPNHKKIAESFYPSPGM